MDAQDWLISACEAVTADIGGAPSTSAPTSTTLRSGKAASALQIIGSLAAGQTEIEYAGLLQALSTALGEPALSSKVAQQFWSLVPDLMSWWIGRKEAGPQVWEARLETVAAICGSFPHLWP